MPHNTSLPTHRYVLVHAAFVHRGVNPFGGLVPAVWFGLSSHTGRMFGCHVMLESGATVLDLPLHALVHAVSPDEPLPQPNTAVVAWDSFGYDVELFEPPYLSGLSCRLLSEDHKRVDARGEYWFSMDWVRNGFSDRPEQHKHLLVVAREDGALVALPQDRVLFHEASFTVDAGIPPVRRQDVVWSAEP